MTLRDAILVIAVLLILALIPSASVCRRVLVAIAAAAFVVPAGLSGIVTFRLSIAVVPYLS
jgi:hypothetical protein